MPTAHLPFMGSIGILGVRVFFVLSGFLITFLLLEEQASEPAPFRSTILLTADSSNLSGILRLSDCDCRLEN